MSVNAISKLVHAGATLALAMLVATPLPAAASAPTSNGKWHVTKFDPNSVPRTSRSPCLLATRASGSASRFARP